MKKKRMTRVVPGVWTLEEMRVVERLYGTLSPAEIGAQIGRSWAAVKTMAHKLGVCRPYRLWTEEERAVLLTHYAAGVDMKEVMTMLPGRSMESINAQVNQLGIFRRRWTREENDILRKYYLKEGSKVVARLPGRTPSAVKNQTYAMGLHRPRGIKWTQDELALLEQHQHLPLNELYKKFPGRSKQAVCHARMNLLKKQRDS